MSPPNPKRPPNEPPPAAEEPGEATAPVEDLDLPFDDEVAPLQADDPRPQRVPQLPMTTRRRRRPADAPRQERDREFPARFSSGEYEDTGHERACLYVERGPGTGQLVPIRQGVLLLGRASSSDLRLQHPSISRRHAQLTRIGDRLYLQDVGSQNGTYVNRVRLSGERELFSGDGIALGNALLRVRGPGPMPARYADGRNVSPLRVGLSAQRLALLAAASSGLVAVFLTLSAVRWLRPEPSPAVQETARTREPDIEVEVKDERPAAIEEPAPAPAPVRRVAAPPRPAPMDSPKEPSSDSPMDSSVGASMVSPADSPQEEDDEGTEAPAASPAREPGHAPKEGSTRAARSSAGTDSDVEAEVLSQYEAGHAESALALARREHAEELVVLLERFQEAWKAGHAALEAKDMQAAIQHFTTAHELDRQLAQGWGRYAPRIRQALTQAHLQSP